MYKFLGLPQQHNELFYHDLQVDWHNSDQIVEFLFSWAIKPCIVLMLSDHCNMTKAIIPAVCIALGQLIMMSLAKQLTAPQIYSLMKLAEAVTE